MSETQKAAPETAVGEAEAPTEAKKGGLVSRIRKSIQQDKAKKPQPKPLKKKPPTPQEKKAERKPTPRTVTVEKELVTKHNMSWKEAKAEADEVRKTLGADSTLEEVLRKSNEKIEMKKSGRAPLEEDPAQEEDEPPMEVEETEEVTTPEEENAEEADLLEVKEDPEQTTKVLNAGMTCCGVSW